jgi:hypothetical protein
MGRGKLVTRFTAVLWGVRGGMGGMPSIMIGYHVGKVELWIGREIRFYEYFQSSCGENDGFKLRSD